MASLQRMHGGYKLLDQVNLMNSSKEGRLTKQQHLEMHKNKKPMQSVQRRTTKS